MQDGTQKSQKVFVNIPTEVGATEAEEIGASAPCIVCADFLILHSHLTAFASMPRGRSQWLDFAALTPTHNLPMLH